VFVYAILRVFVYLLRQTDITVHMLLICTGSSGFAMKEVMQRKIMLGYACQSIFRRLN
jgi:ABC-type arginine/histidine transport system permease subunit